MIFISFLAHLKLLKSGIIITKLSKNIGFKFKLKRSFIIQQLNVARSFLTFSEL